jgi:hypothetical protein
MSKEQDEKRRKAREEYLRQKKERWDAIKAMPNEKFTIGIYSQLTSDEVKELQANKPGFTDYLNNVLFAAPKPPQK